MAVKLHTGKEVTQAEYNRVYRAVEKANKDTHRIMAMFTAHNGHPGKRINTAELRDLASLKLANQPNQEEINYIMRAIVKLNGENYAGIQSGLAGNRMRRASVASQ